MGGSTMKRVAWGIAIALLPFLSGCCQAPTKTPGTAPVSKVIDGVKDELRAFYETPVKLVQAAPASAACKNAEGQNVVQIKPTHITLTLKTVSTAEHDPTVGLVSPLGVLKFDPSYTGAYSRSNAQALQIDLEPPQAPRSTTPTLAADVTEIKASDHPLYAAVVSMAQELLKVDHTKTPCVTPTTIKSFVYFDVVDKGSAGIALEIVGFKIGDKVVSTDEFHQTLEVDFSLEGSSPQLR